MQLFVEHAEADCIITCHNYGSYLEECLQSCLGQSVPFRHILVVDDGSTDNTREIVARHKASNVRYLRIAAHNVCMARNAGVRALPNQQFLLFVDADNYLEPNYLEALLGAMADASVGIAYTPVRYFDKAGNSGYSAQIEPYDYDRLRKQNIADNCSLVRRDVYDQVGGYPDPGDHQGLADWLFWLRATRKGWRMRKTDSSFLNYRLHARQMSARGTATDSARGVLRHGFLVAIVTLFAGRAWSLDRYFDYVNSLDWPRQNVHIAAVDNSGNPKFAAALKRKLLACRLSSSYVGCGARVSASLSTAAFSDSADLRMANALAMSAHLANLYSLAKERLPTATDLVWTLEDDIEPPADALESLALALSNNQNAGAVAGIVVDRFTKRVLAWDALPGAELSQQETADRFAPGVASPVAGTGFGCTLFRRETWQRIPFRPSVTGTDAHCAYDWTFAHDMRAIGQLWLLCGSVRCLHRQADGSAVELDEIARSPRAIFVPEGAVLCHLTAVVTELHKVAGRWCCPACRNIDTECMNTPQPGPTFQMFHRLG